MSVSSLYFTLKEQEHIARPRNTSYFFVLFIVKSIRCGMTAFLAFLSLKCLYKKWQSHGLDKTIVKQ